MKTTELLKQVEFAGRIIPTNATLPILECVMFENGKLTSTNIEVSVVQKVDVKDKFLVNYRDLKTALKAIKTDKVKIEAFKENTNFRVKVLGVDKKREFTIEGADLKDFPLIPYPKKKNGKLTTGDIEKIVSSVKFTGNDDLRPVMNGVYISKDIVATDAHKLTWKKVQGKVLKPFIMPKQMALLIKGFEDCEVFSTGEKKWITNVRMSQNGVEIIAKTIDGAYPSYKSVIPKKNPILFKIAKKDLIESIECGLICVNTTTHQGRFLLKKSGKVELITEDLYFNKKYNEVLNGKCKLNKGRTFEIGFNLNFLLATIKNINEDVIEMKLSKPNKAGIINKEYLLMPVMLNA